MLGHPRKYLVELDGRTWICDGGKARLLSGTDRVSGSRWWITDFESSISRTMTIEADFRYVELMVSRKLQETGEFDEPVSIITHWKRKGAKNNVDIFFTAVPARVYNQYLELVQADQDHLVLLPLYEVLFNALKKLIRNEPAAVIFPHGRFADVLVGGKKRVHYARRIVAYDTSPEQINSLWESVIGELKTLKKNLRLTLDKIGLITWIDGHDPPQDLLDEDFSWQSLTTSTLDAGDGPREVSLPGAVPRYALGLHAMPLGARLLYAARLMFPKVALATCGLAILLAAAGLFFDVQAAGIHRRLHSLIREVESRQQAMPQSINLGDYQSTVTFLEQVRTVRELPSLKKLVNGLSRAMSADCRLLSLKADYKDNELEVEIFGRIDSGFETAFRNYQQILTALEKDGYRIIERRFDTLIRRSEFMVRFSRKVV